MPNNQPPAKTRIDERANKALADLKKVTDAHPELDLSLKSVKTSLETIKGDPHKAQYISTPILMLSCKYTASTETDAAAEDPITTG